MRFDARVKELTLTNFGPWSSRHSPRVGSRTTIGSCFGDFSLPTSSLPALHYFQLSSLLSVVIITFSCHHRDPLLSDLQSRTIFEQTLERVRRWYGFFVTGYVVMPEHVHLLISEPERGRLSLVAAKAEAIMARLRSS